jgi:hypothetical protein
VFSVNPLSGKVFSPTIRLNQCPQPFPHIIIDDFLPTDILDKILEEFPKPGAIDWQSFKNKSEKNWLLLLNYRWEKR